MKRARFNAAGQAEHPFVKWLDTVLRDSYVRAQRAEMLEVIDADGSLRFPVTLGHPFNITTSGCRRPNGELHIHGKEFLAAATAFKAKGGAA